jgi:hypothetical protein
VCALRRHQHGVSIQLEAQQPVRAAMVVVATGANGAVGALFGGLPRLGNAPAQLLMGGILATGGEVGRWARFEMPTPFANGPARCTLLQTPTSTGVGTALLVHTKTSNRRAPLTLRRCFDAAARAQGLGEVGFAVKPQLFSTAVASLRTRVVGGDGRAPIVVAGDAAQTGHVFSGSTCFVNLALALSLCDELRGVLTAFGRSSTAPEVTAALARYDQTSELGARLLAEGSRRHTAVMRPGAWALAGVARV